ncbi:T9SS type A sorting domain-containing protein [Pontibacter cellulosilyticus]|uniref:T9SS type A sorting domain-containing protein n=1 Tax=Pontibacter cellulosilyticus TaxID=1720253 RepID=A0A923SJW5_9BACT|nr:T9SS type A sorting domain-containing protein [Pontibacter cellulosilyticus]MBC5994253.1 T9SS type A sorting domain-containing protein [Pontibacter cellulosilyticus]
MRISTHLKKISQCIFGLTLLWLVLGSTYAHAQTTSWRGTSSDDWNTAANWTNGVPTATLGAVIGDVNFTGTNQPTIDETTALEIASIELQGTNKSVTLTITNDFNVVVNGDVIVGSNTTLLNVGTNVFLKGSFTNNGVYSEDTYRRNNGAKGRYFPSLEMQGTGKTLGGTGTTIISHILISGSVTLGGNVVIKALVLPSNAHNQVRSTADLKVGGTLNPATHLVTWSETITREGDPTSAYTGDFIVEAGGTAKVMAATYAGNYGRTATLYATSTIDYAAATGTQTVLARNYGILKISGGGIKELEANTTVSDVAATTQLIVEAGTLDLKTFSLNRTGSASPVVGGTLTVANDAFLRIGGTGTFPSGYSTVNLGPTSTVEYYGTNQTVGRQTYGHLLLSGSGTKSMPVDIFTVAGNFSSTGTVNYAAGNDFTVLGNVNIGSGTTLGGSTRTITVGGNWTNNGVFTPGSSTVIMNGAGMHIMRASGTVPFHHLSLTTGQITSAVDVEVFGNLATTGNGKFTSTANLTMSGNSMSITGENITLNNLIGNGTTTTTAILAVNGNLTVIAGKSFTATAGIVNMQGTGATIANSGTLQLYSLRILGTTGTMSNFSVSNNLSGIGTLTATAGTVTFNGASTFGGTHLLHNVTVLTGNTLTLNASANMGISNDLVTAGATLNVTANTPNTITYNKVGTQNVIGREYFNLVIKNSNTKTATGAITVWGNMTVENSSGFAAGSYAHSIKGNLINSAGAAFNGGTGKITFDGTSNGSVTGIGTVFNELEINKSVASSYLELANDVQTKNLTVTSGSLRTGIYTITVTENRNGNGWVFGTIKRQHAFTANAPYAFAGPNNNITLTSTADVTAITVTNTSGVVSSFANGSAINRRYDVNISGGSNYAGTLQLQYNDAELNGNSEATMQLFYAPSTTGPWEAKGATGRDASQNWVVSNTLTNVTGSWTLSESAGILRWVGTTNTDWYTATNWQQANGSTATQAPQAGDIVEFGGVTTVAHQPTLATAATVKAIQFLDSGAQITLTLSGATSALTVSGNVVASGAGTTSRVSTITLTDAASKLNVGGAVVLSGGLNNNLNLQVGAGTVTVAGEINQNNSSSLTIAGGTLKVGGDYNYSNGSFAAAVGSTVNYDGVGSQIIAPVSYHHLTISKSLGLATLTAPAALTINGNLTMSAAEVLVLRATDLTINGNVTQSSGTIDAGNSTLKVAGNWTRTAGTFTPATSTVIFNGSIDSFIGNQADATTTYTFNNLSVSKTGTAVFTVNSNIRINADLDVISGTVSLGLKTIARTAPGGNFNMGSTGVLLLENSNFPANFTSVLLNEGSHVKYQGTINQLVAAVTYGHLTFDNKSTLGDGTVTSKKLQAATTVIGNLTITDDAILNGDAQTLTLKGNFSLATGGQFIAGPTYNEGTLVLAPVTVEVKTAKYLIGAITVHNMLLEPYADYTLSNAVNTNSLTIKGDFNNQGSINGTTLRATFEGNFINTGDLLSSGTAAFTGNRQQTIQLRAPITPAGINPLNNKPAPPTVEFNGSMPPVLNSTTAPQFGSVIINNTGGVTTSVNWLVGGVLYVKPNAKFHGGSFTHIFATGIDNEGLITSSGVMYLNPIDQGIVSILPTNPYYPFKLGLSPDAFQSTGTLRIGGTEMLALLGFVPGVLNNVIVDNTNSVGVNGTSISSSLSLHSNWNIKGNLTVAQGTVFNTGTASEYTLATSATTSVPMSSGFYTVGGNLINNGTINGAGSSFTLTNTVGLAKETPTAASVSGTGSTTMGSLTIETGAGVAIGKTVAINQDFTYKGADLNTTGGLLRFEGTGNSLLKAPVNGVVSIGNVEVNKASTAMLTLEAGINDLNRLKVLAGTLDMATYNVVKPALLLAGEDNQSEVFVANNAVLKIGGKGTVPQLQLDKYTFAENSTVEYYGGSALADIQPVLSVQYGNLSFKNTSTKTFDAGTAKIAGNFTVAAGPAVIAPATIEYNGTAAQTVAAINYNNLTLSTGSAKTLATGTTGIANAFTNSGSSAVNAVANSTTVNYNGTAQNILPINYHNLALSNSGIKTFSGTTGVAASFTTAGTATADLTSVETTIDFNGSGAQAIPGLNYSKILVSNGATNAKSLVGNANVAKELRLSNGRITTGSNKFILGSSATIVETAANYVTGLVETQRTMTTAMESFGGLGISITPAVSPGTVTVLRETGRAVTASNGNQSILRNYAFTVPGTNSGLNATVTFNYFEHELGTYDENSLLLYHSKDGTNWTQHGSSVPDPTNNRLGATGMQALTSMTLGSSSMPLPVELKYLRAEKQGQYAVITWETANEENNKGFEVEVSLDGVQYKKLGFVSKATASLRSGALYTYTDTEKGKLGVRYYRLKQIDHDGAFSYYGPRALTFNKEAYVAATAYPNPFQGSLQVNFYSENSGVGKGILYTASGRAVYEESIDVLAGINNCKIKSNLQHLSSGLYLFIIEVNGKKQSIKVVKE